MEEKENTPRVDTSVITFPTEAVTLGQMRIMEPDAFRIDVLDEVGNESFFSLHYLELTLADKAFRRALTGENPLREPRSLSDRASLVDGLNDGYVKYGLSTGIHQTKMLVRQIEGTAGAQAAKFRRNRER